MLGIRSGLVQASMRYAKANNEKVSDYDDSKEDSWLVYQDCNKLYGWAMSQNMPYANFKWVKPELDGLDDLDETSPIGRIYEVDVSYPVNLHDEHNDLPFLPQNGIPTGSNCVRSGDLGGHSIGPCVAINFSTNLTFKNSCTLREL